MTAPSISGDGAQIYRSFNGAMDLAFTTVEANTIVILFSMAESGTVEPPGTMVATVATVTAGALTWTRRHRTPGTGKRNYVDVWWTLVVTPGSYGVRVTYNSNFDDASVGLLGFVNCNLLTPFDSSPNLPKTTTYTEATTPSVTGITTTQAEALLIWGMFVNSSNSGLVPDDGWSQLLMVSNPGGSYYSYIRLAVKPMTVQQTLTDTYVWGATVGIINPTYGENVSYFDALRSTTGGGGGEEPPVVVDLGTVQVVMQA